MNTRKLVFLGAFLVAGLQLAQAQTVVGGKQTFTASGKPTVQQNTATQNSHVNKETLNNSNLLIADDDYRKDDRNRDGKGGCNHDGKEHDGKEHKSNKHKDKFANGHDNRDHSLKQYHRHTGLGDKPVSHKSGYR